MSKVWFTADTHFGSERTLDLWKRSYTCVKVMDKLLAAHWNQAVKKEDTVYHLGNVGDPEVFKTLKGNIKLVPGNYDRGSLYILEKYCEVIDPGLYNIKGHLFNLIHEPTTVVKDTAFCLFGHIHRAQMVKRNGLNVGVDCHNQCPIELIDVLFWQNAILHHYDEEVFVENCGKLSGPCPTKKLKAV